MEMRNVYFKTSFKFNFTSVNFLNVFFKTIQFYFQFSFS